jgi:DnaJ-domain-containing protein 1
MRGIERWGTSDMLDRAFQGFAALPAPTAVEAWWDVLQVRRDDHTDAVEQSYRRLSKQAHPDLGGSHEAMSRLNQARESFRAERGL